MRNLLDLPLEEGIYYGLDALTGLSALTGLVGSNEGTPGDALLLESALDSYLLFEDGFDFLLLEV